MKKILILMMATLFLSACGDSAAEKELKEAEKRLEEAQKDTERLEDISEEMGISVDEPVDESIDLSAEEVAELIAYEALGEGDIITDVIIRDGEIKAVIEISDDAVISDKSILAESVYSSAGDSLLEYDDWEVLTIEFVGVGEVSMNRDEKETNEFGDYFPLEKIIGQLE